MNRLGRFLILDEERKSRDVQERVARRVLASGVVSPPITLITWPDDAAHRDHLVKAIERAKITERIEHPAILRVLEVGTCSRFGYEALEHVHGVRLDRLIRSQQKTGKTMSFSASLACAIQLLELLDSAHAQGIELGEFDLRSILWSASGRVSVRLTGGVSSDNQGPAADVYRVGRVLRAMLATDVTGKGRAKVASGFSKQLAPILRDLASKRPADRPTARDAFETLCDVLESYKNRSPRSCIASVVSGLRLRVPNGISYSDLDGGTLSFDDGDAPEVIFPNHARAFEDTTAPEPVEKAASESGSGVFAQEPSPTDLREQPRIGDDDTRVSGRSIAPRASKRPSATHRLERSDSGFSESESGAVAPAPGAEPTQLLERDSSVPGSDSIADEDGALHDVDDDSDDEVFESSSRAPAPPLERAPPLAVADDASQEPTMALSDEEPGDAINKAPTLPRVADEREDEPSRTTASIVDRPNLSSLASELGPGTILIEAPKDAAVFVDGRARGRGRVVIDDAGRYQSYNIRVHARGFAPWTRDITLAGAPSKKIKPELQRR